jgi:hypothetical protein
MEMPTQYPKNFVKIGIKAAGARNRTSFKKPSGTGLLLRLSDTFGSRCDDLVADVRKLSGFLVSRNVYLVPCNRWACLGHYPDWAISIHRTKPILQLFRLRQWSRWMVLLLNIFPLIPKKSSAGDSVYL